MQPIANPMQQKINAARQAGYSDQEIQAFLGAGPASAPARAPGSVSGGLTMPGAPTASGKKKKNFFLDQISTIGGIAGGIGGSFIAPVAGTAGGAAVGSGLGEAIENALTGNRILDNVGKEAVIGGVLGGGPLKLAKAGLGLRTAGKEVAEKTVRTAGERGAQKFLGEAWGIKTGAKTLGKTLEPKEAQELQKFIIKTVKPPKTATADMVAERLVNFKSTTGKQIDDIVRASDRVLKPTEIERLNTSIGLKIGKLAGADPNNPVARRLVEQVGEQKTVSDLVGFRRSLDDAINFARNEASPDPITERFARTMRSEIDKFTSNAIPGLKATNRQYSQATKALDYVLPAAKNPTGVRIAGVNIGGGARQQGASLLGQAKGGVAERLAAPSTNTARGIATRVGAGGILGGMYNQGAEAQGLEGALLDAQSEVPNIESMNSTMMPNATQPNIASIDEQYQNGGGLSSQFTRESTLAAMLTDIQETGGKNLAIIQKLYDFANPEGETAKPIKKTEGQRARDEAAQLTEQALSQLEGGSINTGFLSGKVEPIKAMLGKGDPETLGFNTTISSLKAAIAKARAGTSFTPNEERMLNRYAPSVGDSGQQLRAKLRGLQQVYQQAAEREYGTEYAPSSLDEALMQYQ